MDHRDALAVFGAFMPAGATLDEQRMTLSFVVEDDDGVEVEHVLPFVWEVCDACQGRGSYVNPAIDAHGIGQDEWRDEWDEEDREAYMGGRYDVTCEQCKGRRVSAVCVEPSDGSSAAHKAAWAAYEEWADSEQASRSERESEMRYGY